MKSKVVSTISAVLINILILIGLFIGGPTLYVIGTTFAESNSPTVFELGISESTVIRVSNAYVWTNTDASVLELNSAKANDTASVKGLKEGIATVSVGTSVGQVLTFTYKVIDKSNNGGGDPNGGGGGNGGNGGNGGGDPNGGGGNNGGNGFGLKEIPGLDDKTPIDTVLNIDGSEWIVMKNIEMEGSRYAMLLKKTALSHIIFEMSGTRYEGTKLQSEFTKAFSDSHIPEALIHNAVVPKLGDDSTNAVSVPTSKMASSVTSKKDIIFPLSYKEAVDWSGSTSNNKLSMNSLRWWLRTPEGTNQWHYVITYADSPNMGSIISNVTEALKTDNIHLRPAIWVKYE